MRFLFFSCIVLFFSCAPPKPSVRRPLPTEAPYLLVLGTAQDAGYPQVGCTKTCCRRVWMGQAARQEVSSLALVSPQSGEAWLFDASPDFTTQYERLRARGLRLAGIFLTHGHIGHYTGLMYLGREAMGAQEMPVYALPRMQQYLAQHGPWSQLVLLKNVALKPLVADQAVVLAGDIRITPFLVPHRDEFTETAGYHIEVKGRKALFIPDIDKWEKWGRDIAREVQSADAAFLDGTFYDGDELPGRDMREIPHPFIVESMARFAGLGAAKSKVHFIHLNHTNPLLDPQSGATQNVEAAGFKIAREGQVWTF